MEDFLSLSETNFAFFKNFKIIKASVFLPQKQKPHIITIEYRFTLFRILL